VAGGGAGGAVEGGGGGAGGMKTGLVNFDSDNYTIVVGSGGAAKTVRERANPGGDSSAFGFTLTGGGGGGANTDRSNAGGGSGGSGGGGGGWSAASTSTSSRGSGIDGEGQNGGFGKENDGGGGGGAGAVGADATNGTGGIGIQNSLRTGVNEYYAGGGGGYGTNGGKAGGLGGGGNGGNTGGNGTANTGGGGGGHNGNGGGAGGSGIVIVRYITPPTITNTNGIVMLVDPRSESVPIPYLAVTSGAQSRVCFDLTTSSNSAIALKSFVNKNTDIDAFRMAVTFNDVVVSVGAGNTLNKITASRTNAQALLKRNVSNSESYLRLYRPTGGWSEVDSGKVKVRVDYAVDSDCSGVSGTEINVEIPIKIIEIGAIQKNPVDLSRG
jgi:hypothetical protein